jgi:hypothetical protein
MTTLFIRNSNRPATAGRCGLLLIALACFALAPGVQAVSPPPDGGYAGANTAEGTGALFSLTAGVWNTALGFQALYHDTTGHSNTATGLRALFTNTTGTRNTATGVLALFGNTTASFNTADGYQALHDNTTGTENTAAGFQAADNNTTGSGNTAIGSGSLGFNTTGDDNIALGSGAGSGINTFNNIIAIGLPGENFSDNRTYIANIRDVVVGNVDGIPVIIDTDGQLGTSNSSRRFKEDIKPMGQASEAILALKPVAFRYKNADHDVKVPQFGLIAEDVAEVNSDLVARDKGGQVVTVRYDAVNAMLLNEFLKEHRQVRAQQKQIDKLTARLNKQAAQIQKVSDQLELAKPAPRTVSNR